MKKKTIDRDSFKSVSEAHGWSNRCGYDNRFISLFTALERINMLINMFRIWLNTD